MSWRLSDVIVGFRQRQTQTLHGTRDLVHFSLLAQLKQTKQLA